MRQVSSQLSKEVLHAFRTRPNLPPNSWYYIAGSTLSTLNRPDEAARVLEYVFQHGSGTTSIVPSRLHQLVIARKMRESMVKLAAIAGLPKTINALFALKSVTPSHLIDEPLMQSPTMRPVEVFDVPAPRVLQKGQRFFDSIYGKISKRVMGQMDRSGTEDLGIAARLMYGYILSNVSVLNRSETSYVLLAGLIPQDVNPQLKGHLKGALNNGATVDEVRAVRAMILHICELYGMQSLNEADVGGWGWRDEVANV